MNAHILNVMKKVEIVNYFVPVPKEPELRCVDVILDENCLPHHLFQDKVGKLWYQPSKVGLVKVSEEDEICPGKVKSPTLIMSSDLSRHHGIFLRYVRDKMYFVYKKLEEL